MIHHHPADDLLLGLAAGDLTGGVSVLTASHVETCAFCRERLRTLEAAGGLLLEELMPATLSADALARTMAAIDASPPPARAAAETRLPPAPDGMQWPRALGECTATGWRWIGPGMRWSRVTVPSDPAAKVFLLRIGAGRKLAMHTHAGMELTQVLYGRFHDGRDLFAEGDFDETDSSVHHQPEVLASGECICLAYVGGEMVFKGMLARTLGALMGM
ncbi:MAG: cupin domain-containing protein [Variovorax sp.]|nr:cupin domain-containing protein [Variovorax sp.]